MALPINIFLNAIPRLTFDMLFMLALGLGVFAYASFTEASKPCSFPRVPTLIQYLRRDTEEKPVQEHPHNHSCRTALLSPLPQLSQAGY